MKVKQQFLLCHRNLIQTDTIGIHWESVSLLMELTWTWFWFLTQLQWLAAVKADTQFKACEASWIPSYRNTVVPFSYPPYRTVQLHKGGRQSTQWRTAEIKGISKHKERKEGLSKHCCLTTPFKRWSCPRYLTWILLGFWLNSFHFTGNIRDRSIN